MNKYAYVIVEHSFDNMENHQPHYSEVIYCASTEDQAKQSVAECKASYGGYDGKAYPYRTYQKVPLL